MRVAVLADIHGNVLALDAVLADVERQSVDAVVVLGDLADRGPFPHKVIERVQAAAHVVLLGNTDEMFLQMDRRDVPEAWVEAEQYAPVRWTYARLTQADLAFLGSLPEQHTLDVPGLPPVRFVHGSPRSNKEPVYPDRNPHAADMLRMIDEDVLALAHTHIAWQAHAGRKLAFNPGSVGQPFGGDPRAQYALLTGRRGRWEVEQRAVDYDRAALDEAFRASGLLAEGGAFARAARAAMMTGRDELWPFLRHAFRVAGEEARHYKALPDDVWRRAAETYDWARAEAGGERPRR